MTYSLQDQDNFLIALEQELGNVSEACKRTGISRETHYGWTRENESYNTRVIKIKEVKLDWAERLLEKHMQGENGTAATIFYLKCQGKNRGYREKDPEESNQNKTTIDVSDRLAEIIISISKE